MSAARIVEDVDVFEDRQLRRSARRPRPLPQQLGLDRLEERLDGRIVVAISRPAHRHLEAVLAQDLLVIVRAVLGGFNRSSQHLRSYPF